jgi:hypothetical protein
MKTRGAPEGARKETAFMRTIGCAIAGLVFACSAVPSDAEQAAGGGSPVAVQVPAAVLSKANSPKPAANASKKTSIGKGKAAINTANAPGDDDSFWAEEVDMDGDGTMESADVLWDDEDKVLFLYDDGDFKCTAGGTGSGDMLIAINGQGNSRGRPAGSGWYLVTLDEGECKAKTAGAYGCKFDAKGNPTACGVAVVDEKNDDLVIATASN